MSTKATRVRLLLALLTFLSNFATIYISETLGDRAQVTINH